MMDTTQLCKLLIVDDEILTRQGIRHFIDWEQEGFIIVGEAANGKEALELIEHLQPHIVLTDIVMPVMDGEALTKAIKEHYPHIEVIVLSSFGEFDYVRSTFQSGVADYILKPKLAKQHLLTVLHQTMQRIPALSERDEHIKLFDDIYVGRLLEGIVNGYDFDYTAHAEQLKKLFPYEYYWIIGLEHRDNCVQKRSLLDRWQQIVADHLGETQLVTYPLPCVRSRSEAIILCTSNEQMEADITKLVTTVAPPSHIALEEKAAIKQEDVYVVTERFSTLLDLAPAYMTMNRLLDYGFYLHQESALFAGKLPTVATAPESLSLNQLTDDFKRRNFDQALTRVRQHVKQLSQCYTTDVFEFKTLLGNLVFNITVLLSNLKYDVSLLDQEKYQYFKFFEQSLSAAEAIIHFERFLQQANDTIASRDVTSTNENIRKLIAYIEENYAEPLTLTDLAQHFHFHPAYLSNYFSIHNSEGFVEYLHKIRIEKAEQLLTNSDEPISTISSQIGYADHSYFCKVFKKGTGLSPSQYRRKNRSRYD